MEYRILEVEGHKALPEISESLKDSLRMLQNHPGFQYLMMRFRLQRALAREALENGFDLPEVSLRQLQARVADFAWMERELAMLTSTPQPSPVEPSEAERELFLRAQEDLELVG